jgi:hypothetical protein
MPSEFISSEKRLLTYWIGHLREDSVFNPPGDAKQALKTVCKGSLRIASKKLNLDPLGRSGSLETKF